MNHHNKPNQPKIELLAPVGHFAGLKAAVANGADAIYVGGKAFGARQEAAFTDTELIEVIKFCHLHNVRVYITLNTTIFADELLEVTNYIHFLYENHADALIIQDLGVVTLAQKLYPDFEIHLSTQMHLHNRYGFEFAKTIGALRVVAARENSLAEIRKMCAVGLEVEVFVHGALCVAYSGQCLMSSMIGARSGNRGACAQPCRLPATLINCQTSQALKSDIGDYLLSPRDLNTITEIDQLINAGVTSFKIEGRLKKPEYVAVVVRAYRQAIDESLAGQKISLKPQLHHELMQVFNRTFTKGFLFGQSGRNWIGAHRSGHRGILIGTVIAATKNRATLKLIKTLQLHDGVRFICKIEQGMQVQKMFSNSQEVKVAKPGIVELICNFTPQVGMKVYKTTDSALAATTAAQLLPPIPISGAVNMITGKPLELTVWDRQGNVVSQQSSQLVQPAKTKNLTQERLKQQLTKTGNTPFVIEELTTNLGKEATIAIATVNKLRRDVLEELVAKRQQSYPTRALAKNEKLDPLAWPAVAKVASDQKLTVSVRNLTQLATVCTMATVDLIYFKNLPDLAEAVAIANRANKPLICQLASVSEDATLVSVIAKLKKLAITTVMVADYGAFEALRHDFTVLVDYAFNANNQLHLQRLAQQGAVLGTLSYELSRKRIHQLVKNSPLPLEAVVFTRIPLMMIKHCPLKAHYQSTSGACQGAYCQINHGLSDRFGNIMPLRRSGDCQLELLNYEPLIWLAQIAELVASGLSSFRLEFITEEAPQIKATITAFDLALRQGVVDQTWLHRDQFTVGHYYQTKKI